MTPSSKSRLPIYAGAWLATAVVTFCLGRITSGPVQLGKETGAKGNGSTAGTSSIFGGNSAVSSSNGKASEDILGRVFGGHATSLDQVIGGKTLEEHLKGLLKVDDEATRMLGFLRLLEALNNPDDIKAALELIAKEGRGGGFRVTEQSMLLQKWAQMDPKAAAAFASTQRDFSRLTGMNAVLRTWLKSSPEEAIAWAEANGVQNQNDQNNRGPGRGGPDDGNWAIATLIGPLAQQNLERALELAKNQTDSRARGRMIDTLVDEMLAQRGMDAARNSLTDLPDDAFRAGMAGRLVDKMMANGDPKDVATQAWNFPTGETRERAMSEVIRKIADDDPVTAANLVKDFGNSPDLDSAKASLAWEILRQDPEGAIVWVDSIADQKQRAESLQRLLSGLSRQNPALAQQYAAQYGVDLASIQQRRGPDGGGGFGGGAPGGGGFGGRRGGGGGPGR